MDTVKATVAGVGRRVIRLGELVEEVISPTRVLSPEELPSLSAQTVNVFQRAVPVMVDAKPPITQP